MRWQPLRRLVLGVAIGLLAAAQGAAQPNRDAPSGEHRAPPSGVLSLLPADAISEHEVEASGERLAYTARAGVLTLRDQNGERSAAIFYTAYTLKGAVAENRPVTFAFNGGPGASAAYLHLGLVGPRVVDFGPRPDGASARLRNNPDTWLRFTDLVLVDPVGTGWSRAAAPEDARSFWSVEQDAQSLAKAIALYIAHNGRTASPKYLLGESYGGFRAIKVAQTLQREQGTIVAGIVMVSPFLEGALQLQEDRFALGAALLLPPIAAAELDRRDRFTAEALASAERFAMSEYLVALAGRPPEGEAARSFYARVAEITGLPVDVVAQARGFIGEAYLRHARDGRPELVSPYDAAFAAPDPFPELDTGEGADPILDGYLQSLGGLFVGYARNQLGFETDMTYMVLNREVSRRWDWNGSGDGPGDASASRDLRELLTLNPSFRFLIAHGRSDLVTPYTVSRYVLDHLPEIGAADRTQLKIYKGGHMFYFSAESRAAFTADAQAFYRSAGP